MAERRCKVVVVMEAVWDDTQMTPKDIMENTPDWIESALRDDGGGYHYEDPTVYLSIEDFDADRAERADHFGDDRFWLKREAVR